MTRFTSGLLAIGLGIVFSTAGWVALSNAEEIEFEDIFADESSGGEGDLFDMSIEELINLDVYSAAKKTQRLQDTPAAVYVVTREEIRRSGATSIPELLRMIPGVEVAHIDANKWAITIRGFNGRFANKLLVLIDGRSVYTPTFAGVYWDTQDTFLEDIDRIEVVRGPGGTLWGANAVNGVINIITRSAADTVGSIVTLGSGTEERGFIGARHGFEIGDDTFVRVYAKYFDRREFVPNSGGRAVDAWDNGRAGFRADWSRDEDSFTLQGDVYEGGAGSRASAASLDPPNFSDESESTSDFNGANVLARWQRSLNDTDNLQVQTYYDRTEREGTDFADDEVRDTLDFELQHRFNWHERHDTVWGLGYRYSSDRVNNGFNATLSPAKRDLSIFNAFVQDEVGLFDDRLRLAIGAKLEHNDFTGWELQPNARFLWKLNEEHTFWGAIARSVRTPSRAESDARLNRFTLPPGSLGVPDPTVVALAGNDAFESEVLLAMELGYRATPLEKLWVDIALFYNLYDNLRTFAPRIDPSTGMPVLVQEVTDGVTHSTWFYDVGNAMDGTTGGAEIAIDYEVSDHWSLRAGYTFLAMDLNIEPEARADSLSRAIEESSPDHQAFLRSHLDLPKNVEFDASLRWVDQLPSQRLDDYLTADARIGWNPTDHIELSIVGQNLLRPSHKEFSSSALVWTEATQVPRGVYGKLTVRF